MTCKTMRVLESIVDELASCETILVGTLDREEIYKLLTGQFLSETSFDWY